MPPIVGTASGDADSSRRTVTRLTFPRVHEDDSATSKRLIERVLLPILVLLTVASILLCLPALHGATGLHRSGTAVDAFDLGVRVSESAQPGVVVVLLGASALGGFTAGGASRGFRKPAGGGADRHARWRPSRRRTCAQRTTPGSGTAGPDDCDPDRQLHDSARCVASAPRNPRAIATPGGFRLSVAGYGERNRT